MSAGAGAGPAAGTRSHPARTVVASLSTLAGEARGAAVFAACVMLAACGRGTSPADSDWRLHGRDAAETRYSPLDQINGSTVQRLGLAWSFEDFVTRGRAKRGNEATPIVVDGVLYLAGAWNVVYALDGRTGRLIWTYDPDVDGAWARRACCGVVSRGVAYADGRIYVATLDGNLDAVDTRTGKRIWRTDTFIDRTRSYAISGAPRIAGDKIVIGNGGGEMGVRGYVSAYDLRSGRLSWRFFTVPGDPRRGPDEHPEVTLSRKTWSSESRWDLGGGGTAWDSMTYDPDTNLLFVGVGNGSPHPGWTRSPGGGANLFLSSIVAVDADTGRMRWYYQTTPGDSWDYTATQNMIMADLEIGGRRRKVLMQAPKNGYFYVLDRETGELLSASKYTKVSWSDHIDLKTGAPVVTADADFSRAPKVIWPSEAGGHNWQPMAFNPQTKLVYVPVLEAPMEFTTIYDNPYRPNSVVQGVRTRFPNLPGPDGRPVEGFTSVLKAWDPVAGRVVWSSEAGHFWSGGGILTTAGGLVFQGRADGLFTVRDARSGKLLKSLDTGSAILAPPITYMVNGVQYVAVSAGHAGAFNWRYLPNVAPLTYEDRERLLVFKLDGGAVPKPPRKAGADLEPLPTPIPTDAAKIDRGSALYAQNCARCHGVPGAPGAYPDLANMAPAAHEAFADIVLDGSLSYGGMAGFADVLTPADVDALHAFLKAAAVERRANVLSRRLDMRDRTAR